MQEISPTPEPSEWRAHRRDYAWKRASEALPTWADWIVAIVVGAIGGWVGDLLGGLTGGIVGAFSGLILVRLLLFIIHWVNAPAMIWAIDQRTIAAVTAERDQLRTKVTWLDPLCKNQETQIHNLERAVASQERTIAELGANWLAKLGSDEPITPPSITFQTINYITAYIPPIKQYRFSLEDPAKGLYLRALCEGWLNGEVAISVASSAGSFPIEPSRRSENTFAFRIPDTLGGDAVLSVNFQTLGTVKIRELEEQAIETASSLKGSDSAAIVPSREILSVTIPADAPALPENPDNPEGAIADNVPNYVRFQAGVGPGQTKVITRLGAVKIANNGDQPIRIEDLRICILQHSKGSELQSRDIRYSSSAGKLRLEGQDFTEFDLSHWFSVDEKIPADQAIERTRLRVTATRIGTKYFRLPEEVFQWSKDY